MVAGFASLRGGVDRAVVGTPVALGSFVLAYVADESLALLCVPVPLMLGCLIAAVPNSRRSAQIGTWIGAITELAYSAVAGATLTRLEADMGYGRTFHYRPDWPRFRRYAGRNAGGDRELDEAREHR